VAIKMVLLSLPLLALAGCAVSQNAKLNGSDSVIERRGEPPMVKHPPQVPCSRSKSSSFECSKAATLLS
jgi:hypothetical protein